jgi:hypothetical protein
LIYAQLGEGTKTFDVRYELNRDFSSLSGGFGGFVSNNLLLGSNFGTSYFRNSLGSLLLVDVNPYARYYFNPKQNNSFFYLQVDYFYNRFFLDGTGISSGFGFNLGLDHFIAPGVSLNTLAGINYRREFGTDYIKTLDLTVGLDAFLLPVVTNSSSAKIGRFQKGSLLVGGSTAGLSKIMEKTEWFLSFNPRIGYFWGDKLAAGSSVNFRVNKAKIGINNFTLNQFSVSPFIRYYLHFPKKFNPFITAEFSYTSSTNSQNDNAFTATNSSFLIGPGGNYFITPNLAFEGILGLRFNQDDSRSRINFTAGLQYFIH